MNAMNQPPTTNQEPPMGMDPRQRIAMALAMQRGLQPKSTGILGGLNQAAQNGLQMMSLRRPQGPPMVPQAPDPVMGTGYPMMGMKG